MTIEQEGTKDLAYYLEHEDELPNDPATLARIFAEAEAAGPGITEQVTKEAQPEATQAKEAGGENKGSTEEQTFTKDGKTYIVAKDGKNLIPFDVLEGEKRARQEAERKIADLEKANADIQRQLGDTLTKMKSDEARQAEQQLKSNAELDPELVQVLEEQFPSLMKVFNALRASQELDRRTIAELRANQERLVTERRQEVATEIDDLLSTDNAYVKALNGWRGSDKPLQQAYWSRAVEVERDLLKEDQKWAKDDVARYAEVTRRVMDEAGLPHPSTPKTKTDTESKANKAIESARQTLPNSLSDISGGQRPAATAVEEVGDVDPAVLGYRFMQMNQADRDAWLSRLG